MVVGGGNGLGVVVVQARGEGADYEVVRFEGLVHGRRLMHSACDGLKVEGRENIGVAIAVPAHHVKRMAAVGNVVQDPLLFNFYHEFSARVDGRHVRGKAEIPLTIGTMLEHLAKLISVPLGRNHGGMALDHQHPVVGSIKGQLVDGATGNHNVIRVLKAKLAKHGPHHPTSLVNEEEFIAVGILVEIVLNSFARGGHINLDIRVKKYSRAGFQEVICGQGLKSLEHARMDISLHGRGGPKIFGRADMAHHGGAVRMVEQTAHTVEAFRSKELLVVESAFGLFVDGVALGRHRAKLVVVGHS